MDNLVILFLWVVLVMVFSTVGHGEENSVLFWCGRRFGWRDIGADWFGFLS